MANYSNLKAAISAAIKTNGNQEITGQVLQDVLNSIVSVIGANYTFAGVATPATNPGTPDQNVVYMASQAGTYTNFGGIELPDGISLLMWNGAWMSETVMYGNKIPRIAILCYHRNDAVALNINTSNHKLIFDDGTRFLVENIYKAPVSNECDWMDGAYSTRSSVLFIVYDITDDTIKAQSYNDVNWNNHYIIGSMRVGYGLSTDFVNADFPFNYTVDGKLPHLISGESIEPNTVGLTMTNQQAKDQTIAQGATSGVFIPFDFGGKEGEFFDIAINQIAPDWINSYRIWSLNSSKQPISQLATIDVAETMRFTLPSDVIFVGIQLYIGGLKKDAQDTVIGGTATFTVSKWFNNIKDKSVTIDKLDDSVVGQLTEEKYKTKAQFYNNDGAFPIIKSVTNKIYFKSSSGMWAGRGSLSLNYPSNEALATAMGVTLVDISETDTGYFELASSYSFVIDGATKTPAIKHRDNVAEDDIVLLVNVGGYIKGLNTDLFGYPFIENQIIDIQNKVGRLTPIQERGNDFATLFQNTNGPVESLIFFTDPHWFGDYNTPEISDFGKSVVKMIRDYFNTTPTNFVLSGGDWLLNHKQSVAIKDLAYIDGLMNKLFPNNYYPMFGNHDNNYQGELDETEDTSANDGKISDQTMINLWFRKWGKMYYTFMGTSSRFYIFDSGIDWESSMTAYRWEQIDWFAQSLLSNNDTHIIIGVHIVTISGGVQPFANNITLIAQAFNNRTSITLNGVTYDFSDKTGKVHCILTGHTHNDNIFTLNDIPVFVLTTTWTQVAFDLILFDYYENKLKAIRVGVGTDRIMNLA